MSYLSLARKYRPNTFADLVGQESVGLALANAIRLKREPRGVIFTGVRGIGKTTTARIYAKALNCDKGPCPEPCNVCASCVAIQRGSHEDVLEIDGASNTGVDDVRALQETLAYVPQRSAFKIYIIDEVHMLSVSAFNALLKTLEEPPEHIVFVFATTELHKVPETIQSRCQIFHLQKISTQLSARRMATILDQEAIPYEERAIQWIAREGKGSLRDALTLLDQVIAIGDGSVLWSAVEPLVMSGHAEPIYDLLKMLLQKNSGGILSVIARWDQEGLSMVILVEELIKACRNAFVLKTIQGQSTELELLDLEEREQQALKALGQEAQVFDLNRLFRSFVKCLDDLRSSELDRFVVENYALEWCLDPGLPDLTALFQSQNQSSAPQPGPQPQGASAQVAMAKASSPHPGLSEAPPSAPKVEGANPPVDLRNRWKQTSGQLSSPASSPLQSTPSSASIVPKIEAAPLVLPKVEKSAPALITPKAEAKPSHSTIPSYASGPLRKDSQSISHGAPEPGASSASAAMTRAAAPQGVAAPLETLVKAPEEEELSTLHDSGFESLIPASLPLSIPTPAPSSSPMRPNEASKAAPQAGAKSLAADGPGHEKAPEFEPASVPETLASQGEKGSGFAAKMSQKSMAAIDAAAAHTIAQTQERPASAKPAPVAPPSAEKAADKALAESVLWPASWKDFVDEWKKQKPLQARVLEETYSLEYSPERIRLAVEAESLAGQKLLHFDTRKKLLVHFEQLFGFKGLLDVVPKSELTAVTDNEPEFRETLLETKQKVKARERDDLKSLLQEHPLTREAILAFDGTIEAIEVQ